MIDVVILAAGESKRFKTVDGRPKQFVEFVPIGVQHVEHQMWFWSQDSLTIPKWIRPAIRVDHFNLFNGFSTVWPLFVGKTRGQAETLYLAISAMRDQDNRLGGELLVVNCDAGFAPGHLDNLVLTGRSENKISCLTFLATAEEESRWSFVDDHPQFLNAAEKRFLSPNALAGAYYFPDVLALYAACHRVVSMHYGEPYISHVLANIPAFKVSCRIPREDWYDWGTTEAFANYMEKK